MTFFALTGGGEAGGELFIECNEDTECLARLCRVFPGSLSAINFRTACGLSVPEKLKSNTNKAKFKSREKVNKQLTYVLIYLDTLQNLSFISQGFFFISRNFRLKIGIFRILRFTFVLRR